MRLILVLFFSSIFLSSFGQEDYSVDDKKAIKYYEVALQSYNMKSLDAALDKLNSAIEREPDFIEAFLLSFEIYIEKGEYGAAEKSLLKALTIDADFFPNGHFFFAELKYKNGDYKTAKVAYEKFLTFRRTNPNMQDEATRKLTNCDFALSAMEDPVPFEPVNLGEGVNSEHSEYFASLTTDDKNIYFTRRLPTNIKNGEQEDFYRSSFNGDWQKAEEVFGINTPLNEGAPFISPDGSLFFFVACADNTGEYGPDRNGYGSCDIFYSTRIGETWSKPNNIGSSINTVHWETQPSFSSDGRTLYFIRGLKLRDGTISKEDIWTSTLDDFGAWSKAVKVSDVINTPQEESSVLIHPDSQTLYFTSNGHPGMGGEDIFLSRKQKDGTWGTPVNLGYPINTYRNENSITVSANGRLAYFASNREGGYGGLDLYSFELAEGYRPMKVSYMEGKVIDKDNGRPLGAHFELIDLETEEVVVESFSNGKDGTFLVSIPEGRDYALNVEHRGYLFYSENFSLAESSSNEPYKKRIELSPIKKGESVVLRNVFYATNSFELNPKSRAELNTLISFLNKNYRLKVEISGHTDNVGSALANKTLSDNRASAVRDYLIKEGIPKARLLSKGYGAEKPIAENDTEEGRAQNRRTEFK
ncbi:MAG: OmpA family protein, partial [Flavobacteriales bacterium]|nr:OmpA family protein [Flavobacteriales bacterium]